MDDRKEHTMNTAEKVIVTVPLEIDADELWQMIFGSEFETWDWWEAYTNFQDGDWDRHCLAEVYHFDEEDGTRKTFQLRIDNIADAVSSLIQQGYGNIANAVANQDFDASTADMVIQQACFGEIVYG